VRRLFLLIGSALLSNAAIAGGGTTGAASLKLGAGAHGQALGDAYSAMASGAEALFWNPAGMSVGSDRSVMFGYQPMLDDASLGQAAASARFGRLGLGLGFNGLKQADLNGIDDVGNATGNFQAQDQMLVAGASFGGPRFASGLAVKYWRSEIDGESAGVLAVDLGMNFQSPLSSRLRHALVVRHLGGSVSYVDQEDPLPTTAVFGNSFRISQPLTVEVDASWERDFGAYGSAGLEWGVLRSSITSLNLRGGYTSRRSEIDGLSGAAFGLGLGFRTFSFDYAWVPSGELGDAHSFTFVWRPAINRDPDLKRRRSSTRETKPDPAAKGKIESRPTGRRQLQDLAPPRKK